MYAYFLAILLLFSNIVSANASCDITNLKDFYLKVKENGPLRAQAAKRKEEVSSTINLAEQRPNPELDFEYLKGDQFGIDVNTYTLSAQHIIEYGSKRDKRIAKARSYQKLKDTEIDLTLFNSNLNAAISYQRVAQLNVSIDAVKEAIHAFDKIIKKLSTRKRLNPEETVSLSTLILASNGYKAHLNDLKNEKTLLVGKISFLVGCKKVNAKYEYLKYTSLSSSKTNSSTIGLIKLEDFKVDLAHGELEVQRSLGYSNISIGPSIEYQEQGNDEFVSIGVSVSFALPLFNTNNGGKLNALKRVSAQRVESSNKKKMLSIKRANLLVKYERSLKTLKMMPKLKELESKHQKVEKLFARGVVSISMTIESHRQQIDFLKSRFETENDVLETFGKINLINGNTTAFEALF